MHAIGRLVCQCNDRIKVTYVEQAFLDFLVENNARTNEKCNNGQQCVVVRKVNVASCLI